MTAAASADEPTPAAGPPEVDAEKVLADLGRPLAQFLTTFTTSAAQLLRTLLDAAYQRGREDGMREAASKLPSGLRVVHNNTGRPEPVLTAEQLADVRRRNGGPA